MGVIGALGGALFGNGTNIIKDTAEVFMENTEAAAEREAVWRAAALGQFATEFAIPKRGRFDRVMDAVNRLPRPALAIGTLGLFVAAMVDPVWFAARMQGIGLVPEPLWWLMGAIVSFYFGARSQAKGEEFQRSLAETMARTGVVVRNVEALDALATGAGARAETGAETGAGQDAGAVDGRRAEEAGTADEANPALAAWQSRRSRR